MTPSPGWYRWALVIALVLGVQVGLAAISDAWAALNLDAPPQIFDNFAGPESGLSAASQRAVWLASVSGERSAIQAMLPWRVGIAVLLALASLAVAVQALRLRLGAPGESVALFLSRAATVAAIFRTLDGAQNLVVARVMSAEIGKALITEGMHDAQLAADLLMAMFSAGSVVRSLVIVAVFLLIGAYFRSDALRALLKRAD